VRGFALFGVLMVNLEDWFRAHPYRYTVDPHPWPGAANIAMEHILVLFFENKFFSLFSLLFGIGLGVQMERAEARGARAYRLLLRRLAVLFVIGALHVLLIWMGDILHIYAIGGLALLFFLRRKTKTIAIVCACLFALPVLIGTGMTIARYVQGESGITPPDLAEIRATIDKAVQIYGHGTWLEIARFRVTDYIDFIGSFLPAIVHAFAMFLIGLAAWKHGILKRPAEHRTALRRTLLFGTLFGFGMVLALHILITIKAEAGPLLWMRRFSFGFFPAAQTAMALAYGAALVRILERPSVRARLAPLGAMGRMALSNYLLQSLLCSFIFYGFGLGLYDRLGPAAGALIAIAIYSLHIPLSRAWMSRFRFGPVEWLWRSLTYGKAQPMKLALTRAPPC